MSYNWNEHIRDNIWFQYRNFNGGLSLRKREDMILVIDSFPPKPTSDDHKTSQCIEIDAEDCYFVTGCHVLGLPIGNDEESSHFAVHYINIDEHFLMGQIFCANLNLQRCIKIRFLEFIILIKKSL